MYKQYQLPYAYEALEPHIDALTMETHYSKHHAAYTKNLNDAAEKAGVAGREITELLATWTVSLTAVCVKLSETTAAVIITTTCIFRLSVLTAAVNRKARWRRH